MNRLDQEIQAAGQPARIEGPRFSKTFCFAPDFVGFQGHFPGEPILPGVVQLMAGSAAAMEATGKQLKPKGVSRAKFTRRVVPDETLVVTGELTERDGEVHASITIECGGERTSTFTIILAEEAE